MIHWAPLPVPPEPPPDASAAPAAPRPRPTLQLGTRSPASGSPTADEILGSFLAYVSELGLELYSAQEEAVFELLAGKHVVLTTPTGSGKSLVATAFLWKAICEGKRGFWSCPVKALVNEKFFDLCAAFGAKNVGLVTGDASVNRDAPILCGTAEILANMCLRGGPAEVDFVVMDEFHYYGDRERGMAWQLPLIAMPRATFLLMSATLGDTTPIERSLKEVSGREVAVISGMARPVPLEMEYRESPLHETIAELVREARAPIYLVNFTQRAAAEEAQNLLSVDFNTKAEKEAIKVALRGQRFASPYGKEMQKLLRHGLGLHHAGLLPRYRRLCERLAQQGLLKVICGTDTLGVGVNIPIRTVLFTQLCKYDGQKDVILSVREFHQIAGRAGRKGFDDRGYVVAQAPAYVIENKRLAAKSAATGKKVHKQKPPDKGYVHWDKGTFDRLVGGKPEALVSRFAVTPGLLLGLLQGEGHDLTRGGGYRRLLEIISACHETPVARRRLKSAACEVFRRLRRASLVEIRRDERSRNPYPAPHPSLQRDFSLHHTLSLYLIETLDKLDVASPNYAFDVLSLVEAILENPRPILMAQLDREKGKLIAELKAAGVEYEERMQKLEEVEWPKPNRDFIYATFNDFVSRHPWLDDENISPKAAAAELLEGFCSFHDYVRELGVARVEGVLLRYLSEVYRALSQSVPQRHRTPEVDELALTLGGVVRGVDASLLEEWEGMRDGGTAPQGEPEDAAGTPGRALGRGRDPLEALLADPRALASRVRAELHRLLGALARKSWDEALEALRRSTDDAGPGEWTAARLEAQLQPFFAERGAPVTTPAARRPEHTHLVEIEPRLWDVQQRLLDREGHDDWAIYARVDLREGLPADGPLIELDRIGI